MRITKQLVWLICSSALVLLVVITLRPQVPLYDGVGFPDEAYRYVAPPSGSPATISPAIATAFPPVENSKNSQAIFINTLEQGPQISAYLPSGSLFPAKPGLVVRIKPKVADSQPAGGAVQGNVYEISTNQPATEFHDNSGKALLTLRLPQGSPTNNPTIVFRTPGGDWQQLQTDQIGSDIYKAPLSGLGDYAMATVDSYAPITINTAKAQPTSSPAKVSSGSTTKKPPLAAIAALAAFIILVAGILVIRQKNTKNKKSPKNKKR